LQSYIPDYQYAGEIGDFSLNASLKLEALYRHSDADVRARGLNADTARKLYSDYVQFVRTCAPASGSVLDVGCGNGWSARLLAGFGYRTTGVDLNPASFEPEPGEFLHFREASSLDLPFEAESFDVVAAYQTLEHIPEPARALAEMLRVLKPGGALCVVGPNLISPLQSLRGLVRYVWQNRPMKRIFVREQGMPRHPCGNTLPEAASSLVNNLRRLTVRAFSSEPLFELREPDLNPPFHSDNDACYLCNPIDVARFLEANGCTVIQNGKLGRWGVARYLAAGTWVAARKRKPPLI
jgi:SAM-dependent methyltransferase